MGIWIVVMLVASVILGLGVERAWRSLRSMRKKVATKTSAFLVRLRWVAVTAAIIAVILVSIFKLNSNG